MVIAIVGVLLVTLALVLLKIVTVPIAMVLVVGGILGLVAVAERRDRGRQRGIGDPGRHFDPNRGILPATADPEPPANPAATQADVTIATLPPGDP